MKMPMAFGSISTLEGECVAERVEVMIDDPDEASRVYTAIWTGRFVSTAALDIEPGPYLLTLDDGRRCQIEIVRDPPFYDAYIIGLGELRASGEMT